jgi:hypothetical protein
LVGVDVFSGTLDVLVGIGVLFGTIAVSVGTDVLGGSVLGGGLFVAVKVEVLLGVFVALGMAVAVDVKVEVLLGAFVALGVNVSVGVKVDVAVGCGRHVPCVDRDTNGRACVLYTTSTLALPAAPKLIKGEADVSRKVFCTGG